MMRSPPPLRAALRRAAVLALMLAAIAPRPAGADEAAMREATALADLTASEATMAPVLALPSCNASSTATAVAFGPKER